MKVVEVMSGLWGRFGRFILSLVLLTLSYTFVEPGWLQIVLIAFSVMPLVAALFNFWVFAPLFGGRLFAASWAEKI